MATKSKTANSTPPLSEAARHLVYPPGITTTVWPRVRAELVKLGVELDGWEASIATVALGKRADGKYAATVGGVVLSIPRQVGKTFLVAMLVIGLCRLFPGLTVVWTAHRTRTATQTFHKINGYTKRKAFRPHMLPPRQANGEQEIRFRNGSTIMFGAREQGFGRGFDEVDIEVFDEAQILTQKALEDMVPAANQSRHPAGALLFFLGTPPRPSDPGDEFAGRRAKALSGKSTNMVYVEFGADPDADSDDRAQWAKANPSFPKWTPVEAFERMREQLIDDDSFRREALGIWSPEATPRVIDDATWRQVADPASMAIDRLAIGVDVAPDRSFASVAFAGQRADGLWHVELYEHKSGTGWIVPLVQARLELNTIRAVVVDPSVGLADEFWNVARIKVTLTTERDVANACGQFYDGATEQWLRHTDQPQVNVALSVARKRPMLNGQAWGWNRKTATSDITPLVAETLALWGAQSAKVKAPGGRRNTARSNNGRRGTVI